MDDEVQPDYEDESREYPAARCRECGVITHTCTALGTLREYNCASCRKRGVPCPHGAEHVRDRDAGMHLDEGWKLVRRSHRKGCSRPTGRIRVLEILLDQAPHLLGSEFEEGLRRPMDDAEVRRAARVLLDHLRTRGCEAVKHGA